MYLKGLSLLSVTLLLCTPFLANGMDPQSTQAPITILLLQGDEAPPQTCTDMGDNDSDRLLNCYETNTGVFIDAKNTGTDPNKADTDGDAISDGDEVLGTQAGLDLPGMGLNPLKKNMLLEYDWFNDNLDNTSCAAHSHQPTDEAIARFTSSFASSPSTNPDGSTGITVINDYGQGGAFTGGNFINDADGVIAGGVSGSEYLNYKASNFSGNRNGYFHYVLLPHRYNTSSGSSGQAELLGDDMIVSLQCYSSTRNTANTIMHELGHNIDLRHGGDSNCNYKPNYNSVMSYRYQFPGVDTNCNVTADGVLDYSRDNNRNLDENNLNENLGVCNSSSVPIDWNGSGTIQSSVSFDINSDDDFQGSNCGGTITLLEDYNDWENMRFTGLSDNDGAHLNPIEIINCDNPVQ